MVTCNVTHSKCLLCWFFIHSCLKKMIRVQKSSEQIVDILSVTLPHYICCCVWTHSNWLPSPDWPSSPCELQGHNGKWLYCECFIGPLLCRSIIFFGVCAGWAMSLQWTGTMLDSSGPVCSQLAHFAQPYFQRPGADNPAGWWRVTQLVWTLASSHKPVRWPRCQAQEGATEREWKMQQSEMWPLFVAVSFSKSPNVTHCALKSGCWAQNQIRCITKEGRYFYQMRIARHLNSNPTMKFRDRRTGSKGNRVQKRGRRNKTCPCTLLCST